MEGKIGITHKAGGATKNAEQSDYTMMIAQARQMCKRIMAKRVIRLGVLEGRKFAWANVYETFVETAEGRNGRDTFENRRDLI